MSSIRPPRAIQRFTAAVAAAALAHRARLAPQVPIWELVAAVTRWRLLPLPGD